MGSAPLITTYPKFANYGKRRLVRPTQIPRIEINHFAHLEKLRANRGFSPIGGFQGETDADILNGGRSIVLLDDVRLLLRVSPLAIARPINYGVNFAQ